MASGELQGGNRKGPVEFPRQGGFGVPAWGFLIFFYKGRARRRGCLVLRELERQVCWRLSTTAPWIAAAWRKENLPFGQTNCCCSPYVGLLVGPLKNSLEVTERKISHLYFSRIRK